MQWVVIVVLVVGAAVGAYLMINKVNGLTDSNALLTGDNASLKNQLRQSREVTPAPTPEITPAPSVTPGPSASPAASPTVTPKPTTAPRL